MCSQSSQEFRLSRILLPLLQRLHIRRPQVGLLACWFPAVFEAKQVSLSLPAELEQARGLLAVAAVAQVTEFGVQFQAADFALLEAVLVRTTGLALALECSL